MFMVAASGLLLSGTHRHFADALASTAILLTPQFGQEAILYLRFGFQLNN
jgi:hypothetical protein